MVSQPQQFGNVNNYQDETQPSFTRNAAEEAQATISNLIASGSLNIADLIAKMHTLISENFFLKETIAQNNLALRQQISLVVRWNEQNEQIQLQHRTELSNAMQQISLLENENAIYSTKAKFKDEFNSKDGCIDGAVQILNQKLTTLQNKVMQLECENNKLYSMKCRLEGDITLLKCDVTTANGDKERLQLENRDLLTKVNNLNKQLAVLREEKYASQENSCGVAAENLQQSKELTDRLLSEKDVTKRHHHELQDSRNQVEYLQNELKKVKDELAMQQRRFETKKFELQMNANEVNQLGKIDALETALAQERKKVFVDRENLAIAHIELSKSKRELLEVKEKMEKNVYCDPYFEAKIKSMSEQYDEITAKLLSYEELLGSKNEEISRLKKELGQLKAQISEFKSEGETIAILRAQAEVYQVDFRAEREAREALASDRERLRDEMRHLHTRNLQLLDELEAYQRRHFVQSKKQSISRSSSEEPSIVSSAAAAATPENLWDNALDVPDKKEMSPKEEEKDESLLYCPKCNKSFNQLPPLEQHVNRCLDED